MQTYHFGAFTLSLARHQLIRDGTPLELGGRAFDLLAHLVQRPGEIVSKQMLLDAVWGGRSIEQNNLTVQMSALRRILGADEAGRPFIRTHPRQGYVFVSEVKHEPVQSVVAQPWSPIPQPANTFIGREAEQRELRTLLATHRLVTVAGSGGIGKTRLVLRLGAELDADFADGSRLVDLATIADERWLAEALATAVAAGAGGSSAEIALLAGLRGRHLLLILDNAEHLVDPLARLLRLILAECPKVSMLVTSRERLGVPGESVLRLQPLAAPPAEPLTAEQALRYDSVRLFAARAAATIPGFALDDEKAQAVADICRRLDGIALAIEMAVPRLQVLTPRQIANRLGEPFHLLPALDREAPLRQRTLRGMFDWSWELLREGERALLQRLAVFAGGGSLNALVTLNASTATTEWEVINCIAGLVEKSLVVAETGRSGARYRLLETTRLYAVERLAPQEAGALRQAHATCIATLFEQAETEWPVTQDTLWIECYGRDADNLRAALAWAFGPQGDEQLGLRLVAASYPLWWDLPGLPLREGRSWFDLAVDRIGTETPTRVAARLWLGRSWRDARFGDQENFPAANRAVTLFRQIDEPVGLGAALWRAGNTMLTHETAAVAAAYLAESERVLRTQPPSKFLALCLVKQADLLMRQGNLEDSYARYNEAMRIIRAIGSWYGLSTCASNMADLLLLRGEPERALRQLQDTREELPRELRSPHVATLAAHLTLAQQDEAAHEAAREVAFFAPASGLIGALGWIAETLALLRLQAGDARSAARLAGYARARPSVDGDTGGSAAGGVPPARHRSRRGIRARRARQPRRGRGKLVGQGRRPTRPPARPPLYPRPSPI